MGNDDDRAERRRRQILSCAKDVFAERGYHDASIGEIISRASIARGTFYLYFSSKQVVFAAILDEALSELRRRITRIQVGVESADPPQVQLRQNLVRIISYLLDDKPLTRLLLLQGSHPNAEAADRLEAFFGHATALMQASLTQGIAMGLVRPCNVALVSWALLGAVRGVMTYCLTTPTPPTVEAVVEDLLAFSLRGVFLA